MDLIALGVVDMSVDGLDFNIEKIQYCKDILLLAWIRSRGHTALPLQNDLEDDIHQYSLVSPVPH